MKIFKRALGMSLAVLLVVAFALPAFACDGEKKNDDKKDGDSAVQVQHDVDALACDGKKKNDDKKEGDSLKADDTSHLLACDGDKKNDDKKDDNSFAA